jgi:hypothetical protein
MTLILPYFDRQKLIPWWDQDCLQHKTVCILGAGGIGSHIAMECCRLGIGKLVIIDYERVDPSNLNRQILYSLEDVGKPKIKALQESLEFHSLATFVQLENFDIFQKWQETCNLIRSVDYVVNSLDLPEVKRLLVASACVGIKKPMVYAGTDVMHGAAGMILFQPAGGQPCYECLQATRFAVKPELWPELAPAHILEQTTIDIPSYLVEAINHPPAATNEAIAAAISSIATMEIVKFFHEMPVHNRIILDMLNLTLESFHVPKDNECIICGNGISK